MTRISIAKLRETIIAAVPKGEPRDWYTVGQPWLPHGAETYIVAGSPDPHAGRYVCDFVEADIAGVEDDYTEEEWSSRNWALAEAIAAMDPETVLALLDIAEKAQAYLIALRRDNEDGHYKAHLSAELVKLSQAMEAVRP